jgi:hypothetical protein
MRNDGATHVSLDKYTDSDPMIAVTVTELGEDAGHRIVYPCGHTLLLRQDDDLGFPALLADGYFRPVTTPV